MQKYFAWPQMDNPRRIIYFSFLFIIFFATSLAVLAQSSSDGPDSSSATTVTDWSASWSMAGANPQRTSWTAEEVRGRLKPVWYKPFEPHISQKVQIIADNGLLYIATSNGLYALDADDGGTAWVYPTALPLGHSPTIYNGVAYVGGFDHKIHAINALTGQGLWTFEAGSGFNTSPLVVEGKLYAGNRDGYFYAVHIEGPNTGQLAWKFKTGGSILYSAAYQDGVVYFASNDSHAYALNAATGAQVWKSAKLFGAGFFSYWPVIYQDRVIFSGSHNYRFGSMLGVGTLAHIERDAFYAGEERGTPIGPVGTGSGDWAAGSPTINATAVMQYFANKPWRKTVFVLNRFTGAEAGTAPVLWTGNDGAATRFPPVIGADGVLYQQNNYLADPYIPGGQIAGWQPDNPYLNIVSSDWGAIDEPHAASAGGNLVYWNLCCNRQAGSFDVTMPNTDVLDRWNSGDGITGLEDHSREYSFFNYDLINAVPGYNERYYSPNTTPLGYTSPYVVFRGPEGNKNGIYGFHGDVNPPIPYNGKVYIHLSNTVMAFADSSAAPTALPMATTKPAPAADVTPLSDNQLRALLEGEVQKILDAGHLRPGYRSQGIFDQSGRNNCGDELVDYWHSSADTIVTLTNALPYLSPTMQQDVKSYLQAEMAAYPPYQQSHVGWNTGAPREVFTLPPELVTAMKDYGPQAENYTFRNAGGWDQEGVWGRNPYTFYALWKYAQVLGGADTLFAASKGNLTSPAMSVPSNTLLIKMPHILNAYIAGYWGYLELEKLAGQPESTSVRNELDRLISLRINNFSKDSAYSSMTSYCNTLNAASNFMYLVPELADVLRENNLNQVTAALAEYEAMIPYWFATFVSEGYAEDPTATLYDAHSLFMARVYILRTPADEMSRYLDVPGFAVGDLFYIDKLVALLGKPGWGFVMNLDTTVVIGPGETLSLPIEIIHTGGFTETVTLETSSPAANLSASFNTPNISSPGGQAALVLNDSHSPPMQPGQWFVVPVTATGGTIEQTTTVHVLVGGSRTYLPLTNR